MSKHNDEFNSRYNNKVFFEQVFGVSRDQLVADGVDIGQYVKDHSDVADQYYARTFTKMFGVSEDELRDRGIDPDQYALDHYRDRGIISRMDRMPSDITNAKYLKVMQLGYVALFTSLGSLFLTAIPLHVFRYIGLTLAIIACVTAGIIWIIAMNIKHHYKQQCRAEGIKPDIMGNKGPPDQLADS